MSLNKKVAFLLPFRPKQNYMKTPKYTKIYS